MINNQKAAHNTLIDSQPLSQDYTITDQTLKNSPLKTNQVRALENKQITQTMQNTRLDVEQLTHFADLDKIPASTRRIKALNDFLGQDRAKASVEAGLSLPYSGYNIFAVGTAGLGKRTMIKRLLTQHAKNLPTPSDWVYVNNFHDARQPLALELGAGQAPKFQKAMHDMWGAILQQLERRFSADTYHKQIEVIRGQVSQQQQEALLALTQEGEALSLKLVSKNEEHIFVPVHGESQNADKEKSQSQEMTQEDIDALNPKDRMKIASDIRYMDKKLQRLGSTLGNMEDTARDKVIELNHDIAKQVVEPKIQNIYKRFENVEHLANYLKAYAKDIRRLQPNDL